jgi:glycosyltransferase involved in cell wall biosynthesis
VTLSTACSRDPRLNPADPVEPGPSRRPVIGVVIPALNEERAIGQVISALPRDWVDTVVVADNGSSDGTATAAQAAGAIVVREPRRGYGAAMLRGLAELTARRPDTQIVVFLDGDASDDPHRLPDLVAPILSGQSDLVLGSRTMGDREPGALPCHSRWGNRLACWLIRLFTGHRYTDLGPFRAIRRETLEALGMTDRSFGWTVEMQVRAALRGSRVCEVPVPYRRRIGQSKISGTVMGSIRAGIKILWTIARISLARPRVAP